MSDDTNTPRLDAVIDAVNNLDGKLEDFNERLDELSSGLLVIREAVDSIWSAISAITGSDEELP